VIVMQDDGMMNMVNQAYKTERLGPVWFLDKLLEIVNIVVDGDAGLGDVDEMVINAANKLQPMLNALNDEEEEIL